MPPFFLWGKKSVRVGGGGGCLWVWRLVFEEPVDGGWCGGEDAEFVGIGCDKGRNALFCGLALKSLGEFTNFFVRNCKKKTVG